MCELLLFKNKKVTCTCNYHNGHFIYYTGVKCLNKYFLYLWLQHNVYILYTGNIYRLSLVKIFCSSMCFSMYKKAYAIANYLTWYSLLLLLIFSFIWGGKYVKLVHVKPWRYIIVSLLWLQSLLQWWTYF